MKGCIVSITVLTVSIFAGCASIRSHRILLQPTEVTLTSSVGSILFRLNKAGDLPNAFGGRDVWGGKVDRGFAEVKLLAIDGPVLTLATTAVDHQSTETVMDRYQPFQNRNAVVAVDVKNEVNIGSKETVVTPVILKFDTSRQKDIVASGIKLTIVAVKLYTIQYELQDIMSKR